MPTKIQLTNSDKEVLIDDADLPLVSGCNWSFGGKGYAVSSSRVNMRDVLLYMHRILVGAEDGQFVDHVDGNRLNNQRGNLRIATATQNAQNRKLRVDSKSGYKGVTYKIRNDGRKPFWMARIQVDGKRIRVGAFDSALKAALAYDAAATAHFGDFARLNFPEDH